MEGRIPGGRREAQKVGGRNWEENSGHAAVVEFRLRVRKDCDCVQNLSVRRVLANHVYKF